MINKKYRDISMKNRVISVILALLLLGVSSLSISQTLVRSEPIIGGNLCHYSDGSVIRSNGYCQRSQKNQDQQTSQRNSNRSNRLIRIEPIVGGARCHYADGSIVTRRGDSNCPG